MVNEALRGLIGFALLRGVKGITDITPNRRWKGPYVLLRRTDPAQRF
jgi:hypothetical protein